jgi:hypothetical protein
MAAGCARLHPIGFLIPVAYLVPGEAEGEAGAKAASAARAKPADKAEQLVSLRAESVDAAVWAVRAEPPSAAPRALLRAEPAGTREQANRELSQAEPLASPRAESAETRARLEPWSAERLASRRAESVDAVAQPTPEAQQEGSVGAAAQATPGWPAATAAQMAGAI